MGSPMEEAVNPQLLAQTDQQVGAKDVGARPAVNIELFRKGRDGAGVGQSAKREHPGRK